MKKTFLFILIFTSSIFSQELSDAYLESLPEAVKEDVLKGIETRDDRDKVIYKRPSSMVEKSDSEYAQYKEFINDQSKQELDSNTRFGEYIFRSVQTSFMPINEPNLDGSYILDFGDVLEVQLIGQKDSIEELPIKRDGSIKIPDIGKLFISGLTLESASSLIKAKVKNAFIGVDAYVSLVSIRDIQVLVSGNAYRAGIYTLNGNSSILHAISMAGGIDNNGSYREINLIRDGELISTLDLYSIFIKGKKSLSNNLRSGDTIHITHHKNLVHAISGVNRPMIYELKLNETFSDLVSFANGFSSLADKDNMVVERISNGAISTFNVRNENLSNIIANDNDSLLIQEFIFGKVEVQGAVKMPGYYKISEDTLLSEVLKRAGGFKNTAYPFAGYLDNIKTAKLNQDAKDKLYNKFIKNLIAGNVEMLDESSLIVLESLKEIDTSGRVMAEFDIDVLSSNPNLDTRLEDGDLILIPHITEQVYVYGETNNQGTIKYSPGKSPKHYIESAGGYLKSADSSAIYIIHPNGETISLDGGLRSLSFIANSEVPVYPGSIIFVPQKTNLNPAKTAAIWAPILSSIALSMTSLSVINNR
jgi:protein involved in polysaccharide export with SLBB domain